MVSGGDHEARILIVDDEPGIRGMVREILCESYECAEAGSAEEALAILQSEQFDLVMSDISMGGISGLDLIPHALASSPDTVVMMISGEQNIESAIRAMRAGAFDYVTKPFDLDHVEAAVARALAHHSLRRSKRLYKIYLEDLLRQRTDELNHASFHDALTGLPNRILFEDRVSQALAPGAGRSPALLLLDVDRFKKINDSLGYQAGDRLLREVAERLSAAAGEGVTVARFGGDEFALLVPRASGPRDVTAVAYRLREALSRPFEAGGQELYLSGSIGISLCPGDGGDADALMRNAAAALHRARERGCGSYEFYAADMNGEAVRRLALEGDLRRALDRGEFAVYYQPQYRVGAGGGSPRLCGAEALARWQHPKLGLVPPAEFIPLAESAGLIVPLGEWVLRTACEQNAAWQRAGHAPFRVAVNLSAQQFHGRGLVQTVSRALADARLDPRWLELELTESSLVTDVPRAAETLEGLRALGVSISVDDFGTGYSSLSYLINLPVDTLKIDRSFVTGATADARCAALLRGTVTLARDLGMGVKAEGVETAEQRDKLLALGCPDMQGYLFGRPAPAREFEELIARGPEGREGV
jgi:diguanylate cyclase (GGDEF)-like protein